jgi:hypothetical protein
MINVAVSTLVFGGGRTEAPLPPVRLPLVSQRQTAREIIINSVREQMQELRRRHHEDFQDIRKQLDKQYLEQSDVDRQARQGKVALAKNPADAPDVDKEVRRALQAFRSNSFKMFVDGAEVSRLDDLCTLSDGTKVSFVRLIPLVGG